jgi:hypothetical protein
MIAGAPSFFPSATDSAARADTPIRAKFGKTLQHVYCPPSPFGGQQYV